MAASTNERIARSHAIRLFSVDTARTSRAAARHGGILTLPVVFWGYWMAD